jgi:hypothetical protein
MNYKDLFGSSLLGAIVFLVLLFMPGIIAYWKSTNSVRFLTLPLVVLAWFSGVAYDFTYLLFFWLLAWLCVFLPI